MLAVLSKSPPSVNKSLRLRKRILDSCLSRVGTNLTGAAFTDLVHVVHQQMLSVKFSAVYDSLRSAAGRVLHAETLSEIAWRLSGNMHRLKDGQAVAPWSVQPVKEWVTIQIDGVAKRFKRYRAKTQEQALKADSHGMVHRSGVVISYLVLNGLAAGKTFDKFWSTDFCESIKSQFGFDKFNKAKYSRNVSKRPSWPFLDVREFYRMRLQILVEPELCQFGELGFSETKGTTSTIAWCRELMKKRLRDEFKCPKNFPDYFACHNCQFGLSTCRAACHESDYIVDRCEVCRRDDRYFDLSISTERCLDCAATQ